MRFFLILLCVFCAGGLRAQTEWRWLHPQPDGRSLNGVVVHKGHWVAAGDGGKLAVSVDGTHWDDVETGQTVDFGGVASDGATLVVVADGGRIFSGPSVRELGERPTPVDLPLRDVVYESGRFVAVGGTRREFQDPPYRSVILTSEDGVAWFPVFADEDLHLERVVSFRGGFYAGGSGGRILHSPDGLAWSLAYAIPGEWETETVAAFGTDGEALLAGARGRIAYTNDGLDWRSHLLRLSNGITAVTPAAGGFIAFRDGASALYSTDGENWEAAGIPLTNPVRAAARMGDVTVAAGAGGTLLRAAAAEPWTVVFDNQAQRWISLAFGNGRYVACGWDGIFYSPDGVSWAAAEVDAVGPIKDVLFSHGRFFAAGNGGVWTSQDGVRWTRVLQDTYSSYEAVVAGDGRLVAVGWRNHANFPGGPEPRLFASTDGVHWSVASIRPAPGDAFLHGVHWNGVRWVAVGRKRSPTGAMTGWILHSDNGVDWEEVSVVVPFLGTGVTYGAGHWVVVGTNGGILRSPDARNWQVVQPGQAGAFTRDFTSILFSHGGFRASSWDGKLHFSPDGLVWSAKALVNQSLWGLAAPGDGNLFAMAEYASLLWSGGWPERVRAGNGSLFEAVPLHWEAVAGAGAYRIYRRVRGSDGWSMIAAAVESTSFVDTDVLPAVEYEYRVHALFGGVEGPPGKLATGYAQRVDETRTLLAWGDNEFGTTEEAAFLGRSYAFVRAGVFSAGGVDPFGRLHLWGYRSEEGRGAVGPGETVVDFDLGLAHGLALLDDGRVVAWGDDTFGQTTVPPFPGNAVAVAAGSAQSLVLLDDGTVVAWGRVDPAERAVLEGLIGVRALAVGGFHGLALHNDGTVTAWGENSRGQASVPAGLTRVEAIAAGWGHSLALLDSGTVVAWGDNRAGQAQVPANIRENLRRSITPRAGPSNVVSIAAGLLHSLALDSDGNITAWGDNSRSQTEAPPNPGKGEAVAAGGLFGLIALAQERSYTLSVSADNGRVLVNPDKDRYAFGEEVTLTAVPAEGFRFIGWEGDFSGDEPTVTLTMENSLQLTARFGWRDPIDPFAYFRGLEDIGAGWGQLSGFGDIFHQPFPWFHFDGLWFRAFGPGSEGFYFYDAANETWIWTKQEIQPHAYDIGSGEWVRFHFE